MADDERRSAATGAVTEIPADAWPAWCETATAANAGRTLILHYADEALGDIRLAEGKAFVAIEHDRMGASVTLTIRYGDGVVPMRYVIADPRAVEQHRNDAGEVQEVTIEDATGRRTFVSLA